MQIENKTALLIGLVLFVIALNYIVFPRFIKKYSVEKGIKLAILIPLLGYVAYDFATKEKYLISGFLVMGAVVFSSMVLNAKRKGEED